MRYLHKNNKKLIIIFLIIFIFLSYFHTIHQIYNLHTGILQWDEWDVLRRYIDYQEEKKSLSQFVFSQHNEHRTAVSNFLFILDLKFFGGAGFLQKLLMPILLVINSLLFLFICWNFTKKQDVVFIIYSFLIVLIFASDQHFENLFRAFNLQVISLSLFASLSIIFCAYIEENNIIKNKLIIFSIIISNIICTFSMSGGIFIWPFTLSLLLIFRKRLEFCIVLIVAIIIYYLYFKDYSHRALVHAGTNLLELLKYSIYFIGNPLRQFGNVYAITTGIIGYSTSLFLLFYITISFQKLRLNNRILISLYFISIYVIFISFLVGYGRLEFGMHTALSSRYLSFTDIYWASTFSMLYLVYIESDFRFKRILFSLPALLLLISVILSQGKIFPEYYKQYLSQEKAGMSLFNKTRDVSVLSVLYPDPHLPFALNTYLAFLNLPPYDPVFVLKAKEAKLLVELNKVDGRWCIGHVDFITRERATNDFLVLSGWAFDNFNKVPSDLVVFIDKTNSVVGYGKSYINRDDVDLGRSFFQSPKLGWLGYVFSKNVKEESELTVYASSSLWPSLCKLNLYR